MRNTRLHTIRLLAVLFILLAAPFGSHADSVPDAFSFIDQTDMPLGAAIVSNPITVTGIDEAAVMSITGGEYSVSTDGGTNWSGYSTNSPATVSVNNMVRVRQTSSVSNSATTLATLSIGGVSDTFSATTAAAGDPNANGLVAWWKAEDNLYDSVSGNYGSPIYNPGYAPGKIGQAFSFNGTNQAIAVPDGIIAASARDFSVSAWVNLNDIYGTYCIYYGGANAGEYELQWINGYIQFAVKLENSLDPEYPDWYNVTSINTLSAGVWYHVAGVRRGTGLEIWVNGVSEIGYNPDEDLYSESGYPSRIGAYSGVMGDNRFWNGLIDEVKIYNRALSESEIALLSDPTPIRLLREGSPVNYYAKIQAAYNDAADGDTIQAKDITSVETVTFPSNILIALKGGYDSSYSSNAGNFTTISGSLTIKDGKAAIENIIIK